MIKEKFLEEAAKHFGIKAEEDPENPAQMACAPEGATYHPVWYLANHSITSTQTQSNGDAND